MKEGEITPGNNIAIGKRDINEEFRIYGLKRDIAEILRLYKCWQ
jgi:hypothetical protein